MATKIGYCPWSKRDNFTNGSTSHNPAWVEQAYFELEKLDTWKDTTSRFTECPAFLNYVNNTFVLRSIVDIELEWDPYNNVLLSNLNQPEHDLMLHVHYKDFDVNNGHPIVAVESSFVFVADKPVYVEFLPPYNNIDPAWRLIPGHFNIHSWTRPVLPTFEMLKPKIKIKRGQPLSYIRFRSEDLKDSFSLERIPRTQELEDAVNGCLSVKTFMPNLSWKLHNSITRKTSWLKKAWKK
jgi:hypothetical protein